MQGIAPSLVPTTAIIGTRGLTWQKGPFAGEVNDGLISTSEAEADWMTEQIHVPVIHTLLPSSREISAIILDRLEQSGLLPPGT